MKAGTQRRYSQLARETPRAWRRTATRLDWSFALCIIVALLASLGQPGHAQEASTIKLGAYRNLLASLGQPGHAQQSNDPPAEIVDDLLDLLNQPQPSEPVTPSPGVDAPTRAPNTPPAGPLQQLDSVRRGMARSAELLSRGDTSDETHRLHSDIVRQLDELIAAMENSAAGDAPSTSSQSSASSESSSTSNPSPSEDQTQASSPAPTPAAEPPAQANRGAQPGQSGPAPQTVVELTDPQSLQQSVWGQLPPRVRQQMQSRMVEQFLPSYRAEIESYFQALLNESSSVENDGAGNR